MFKVTFVLDDFKDARARLRSEADLQLLLRTLYAINRIKLRIHPELPRLYESGVRYVGQQVGQEEWCDIPSAIKRGGGDCKILASWRAAELTERDKIPAIPVFRWRRIPWKGDTLTIYHVLVQSLVDGRIEDPSKLLGMGSEWQIAA